MKFVKVPDRHGAITAICVQRVISVAPTVFSKGDGNVEGCTVELDGGVERVFLIVNLPMEELLSRLSGEGS